MKKTKQIMMLMAMVVMTTSVFAQLTNGSYAKDISMKKLSSDGTVITDTICTIHEYTNAGKAVIMDVSAIWCPPCWAYHTSHALKTLYEANGPAGTNEVMVYYVEGDEGTIAQLNGGTGSQGNWVSGTPYPILPTIFPNTTQVTTDYAISAFPTVYLICPDRTVTNLGQKTASQLIAAARACPVVTSNTLDAKIFEMSVPTEVVFCGNITPKLLLQNYGTANITSAYIRLQVDGTDVTTYNWTGNLPRLDVVSITMPTYSSDTLSVGTHSIRIVVDSINGSVDANPIDNEKIKTVLNHATFVSLPIAESFTDEVFPSINWAKDDLSDGLGWARSSAHDGSAMIEFYNIPKGAIDYLILPPVDMTSASSMTLMFKVAYAQYSSSYSDKLEVQVSTDCGVNWATKFVKSGSGLSTSGETTSGFVPTDETQWRQEAINFTSYAGQDKVLVRFKATSAYGNNLYLDEINLDLSSDVKSNDFVTSMSISPNPSNSNANVEFYTQKSNNISVVVVNTLGAVIYSSEMNAAQGFNTIQIPSENFGSGVYFVSIKGENSNTTQKLIIQK